ncbi:MAG: 1,2-phenylacetyl-CoA epoxidase subunit PaaB [Bacteroidota bacterium]|nr:1,2-phenylacetyl-CoA epoxidase subunit B [Candidatus Kapabacteria bacterium]MCS7302526.1 1,2-phenylacetyl-CoA epoxidase subunit B [Candidatus Kapabacteria bacterium]MCX7936788.1 1,2-phenylacetyl-CoA epoxidase subunit B [Chlorobiota bacterium]MDW8074168.1 1,2-phenylacetyl-CoA epoxidase subunit PaaB [Bacteroidota bacterium]MDW8271356.1 1,2-phenylacetyl-CoA epoxidase subunit PaaB [Bacteroidota bacterium]
MSRTVTLQSLDPRVSRLGIPTEQQPFEGVPEGSHLQTFEVFHQTKSGARHIHVGSVHAPNAEMAMVFAKEQYARRSECVNLWVVKTSEIITFSPEDADLFATTTEKTYRDASGYKVMQKILAWKQRLQQQAEQNSPSNSE